MHYPRRDCIFTSASAWLVTSPWLPSSSNSSQALQFLAIVVYAPREKQRGRAVRSYPPVDLVEDSQRSYLRHDDWGTCQGGGSQRENDSPRPVHLQDSRVSIEESLGKFGRKSYRLDSGWSKPESHSILTRPSRVRGWRADTLKLASENKHAVHLTVGRFRNGDRDVLS